jgi:Tol biopolymer transport system component
MVVRPEWVAGTSFIQKERSMSPSNRAVLLAALSGLATLSLSAAAARGQTFARESVSTSGVESTTTGGGFFNGAFNPSVSDDGRFVVFESNANNLVDFEFTTGTQIYLRDRQLGTTTLVSRGTAGIGGNGTSELPTISGDGSTVVFQSAASDLVTGDTNGSIDVFVWDRASGNITRVSVSSTGAQADRPASDAFGPAISANGRYVAFSSTASNLVTTPGGTNRSHIYRHDRQTGSTLRISVTPAGTAGNLLSTTPTISGDGDRIAFRSAASDLVPGDSNAINDIFVRTVSTQAIVRVSLNSAGGQISTGAPTVPAISRDGSAVLFFHTGNVTGSASTLPQLYLRDLAAGTTTRITTGSGGEGTAVFSGDGSRVIFSTYTDNLVAGDTNGLEDVFSYDRATGTLSQLTLINGSPALGACTSPALNFTGSLVVFESDAANFITTDFNGLSDIFSYDATPATPTCLADVVADGSVDGGDFIAFINSFAIGDATIDPVADVVVDGTIDGTDFIEFINAFSAGC